MKSKWLSEITGFENVKGYEIRSDGAIISYVTTVRESGTGRIKGKGLDYKKGKIISGSTDSKGYRYLTLKGQDCTIKNPKIHRLVAIAFVKNPHNKPQVNHIDGDKLNNDISNLEFVTNEENRRHALETGLKKEMNYGVAQYDLEGKLLNIFHTASEALEHLGIKDSKNRSGNIGRCVNGKRKTAYGYAWRKYEGSTTSRETYGVSEETPETGDS